jgi:hypothetical protein
VASVRKGKEARGEAIPSSLQYSGLAWAEFSKIRSSGYDVIYTPRSGDDAHADLVSVKQSNEAIAELRDWLQDNLRIITASRNDEIDDLRKSMAV